MHLKCCRPVLAPHSLLTSLVNPPVLPGRQTTPSLIDKIEASMSGFGSRLRQLPCQVPLPPVPLHRGAAQRPVAGARWRHDGLSVMPMTSEDDNPYEPRECRVCGEPVQVVKVQDQRMSGTLERLVRRCNSPACRLNNGNARMSDYA